MAHKSMGLIERLLCNVFGIHYWQTMDRQRYCNRCRRVQIRQYIYNGRETRSTWTDTVR